MADIIKISEDTYRIEDGGVRCFLLIGADKALMIDSGMNTPDAKSIAESITKLPIELLNTHADRDHISGNGGFDWFYMSLADEENLRSGRAVVAAGMAEFAPGQDDSFQVVFERADREMYLRKKALKRMK